MIKLVMAAVMAVSGAASALVIERTPAQLVAELAAHGCPDDDSLPFPLPAPEITEGWGDAEYEAWEVQAWATYCARRQGSHACRCATLRGGGLY